MSLGDMETFIITWRVKNFSMCPVEMGECIESPVIQVRQFGNSEWKLELYPKGEKTEGFLSCYLKCMSVGVYETVKMQFSLKPVVTMQSQNIVTEANNDFKQNGGWGYKKWILMDTILKEKEKYLPNDTLTIECTMKCKNICDSKNTEDEMVDTLLKSSCTGKTLLYSEKCCCETTVYVQTKRFLRPIRRFLSFPVNERITLPLFSNMIETPSFYVTILKKSKSSIHIVMKSKDDISDKIFVKCTVSVANSPKGVNYSSEDKFMFKSKDDVWNLSTFPDFSRLENDGYFEFNEGTLFLQFDFAFSIEGQMENIEKQDWGPFFPPSKSNCSLEIFTASNTDDESPIVTLSTGDRTYAVHKALLKAKSEVFRAMFGNDMKEKETGIVDIPDVEPETLARMISFLYSGTVDELSTKDLGDLYAAADKYQVQCLMDYCTSILMMSLKLTNVCAILILADLYQNDRLLKCAENFVVSSALPERLFLSKDWKNLMENHASIAANVMYKMLMK